jgi:hypothetical protein
MSDNRTDPRTVGSITIEHNGQTYRRLTWIDQAEILAEPHKRERRAMAERLALAGKTQEDVLKALEAFDRRPMTVVDFIDHINTPQGLCEAFAHILRKGGATADQIEVALLSTPPADIMAIVAKCHGSIVVGGAQEGGQPEEPRPLPGSAGDGGSNPAS